MFVFRGEKLKEKGYFTQHRELEEFKWGVYGREYEEELMELQIQESLLLSGKNEKYKQYLIFKKPISELTPQERKDMVFKASLWGRKIENDQQLQEFMNDAFNSNPISGKIRQIENTIAFRNKQLKEYKSALNIALDHKQITRENVNAILEYIEKAHKNGIPVRVCIDNIDRTRNDEEADYLFTKEEMFLLKEIDDSLKSKGYSGLLFAEFQQINDPNQFKGKWSFEQVSTANNKIDDIVNHIKENNLSPFEAMLYIHKWASSYVYNAADKLDLEGGRVLPSTLATDKIVCSGYSSMIKAVIDRLNIPGLKCDIQGCAIVKGDSYGGHCHNIVHIKDEKYQIDGTYMEDACWDSRKKGEKEPNGFAHCLYPVKDIMHFNGGNIYYSPDKKGRKDNLLFDESEFSEMLQERKMNFIEKWRAKKARKEKYKTSVPKVFKEYGEHSDPIDVEKYKEGLRVMYSSIYDDPKVIEEMIEQDIIRSKATGVKTFNEESSNSFVAGMDKKERKQATKNANGPQTRM